MTNRDTLTEMYSFSPGGVCIVYLEFVKLPSSCQTFGKMSLCLIVSVQTSLTTPVHLCKILYVPLHAGFPRKKKHNIFLLCNIQTSVYLSITSVLYKGATKNDWNLLRYNWDLETLSCVIGSQGLSPDLQFVKKFCQISNFYAMWQNML